MTNLNTMLAEAQAWADSADADDPVPPQYVLELGSGPTEPDSDVWLWDCAGGWTGISNGPDGPVRCGCR